LFEIRFTYWYFSFTCVYLIVEVNHLFSTFFLYHEWVQILSVTHPMVNPLLHSKAASLVVAVTDNITSHQHKSNSWIVSYLMMCIFIFVFGQWWHVTRPLPVIRDNWIILGLFIFIRIIYFIIFRCTINTGTSTTMLDWLIVHFRLDFLSMGDQCTPVNELLWDNFQVNLTTIPSSDIPSIRPRRRWFFYS
jgi:hypothetical protein